MWCSPGLRAIVQISQSRFPLYSTYIPLVFFVHMYHKHDLYCWSGILHAPAVAVAVNGMVELRSSILCVPAVRVSVVQHYWVCLCGCSVCWIFLHMTCTAAADKCDPCRSTSIIQAYIHIYVYVTVGFICLVLRLMAVFSSCGHP